jgi:hypothetical protein
MGDRVYATPEEAARGDIPERYARALSIAFSPDGDQALVVLETNEQPAVELYEVVCYRERDGWIGGSGSGGIGMGWSSTSFGQERNVGVLRLSDEVPDDVVAVIVRWCGDEFRVPVSARHFFFTQWNVPADFDETEDGRPRAVRYLRSDGSEEIVPPARH